MVELILLLTMMPWLVASQCTSLSPISPGTPSDPVYVVGAAKASIVFSAWTVSDPSCSISYTMSTDTNAVLSSWATWIAASRTLEI